MKRKRSVSEKPHPKRMPVNPPLDCLLPLFHLGPANMICDYARIWSGKIKRTWPLAFQISQWVRSDDEMTVFFQKVGGQRIHQFQIDREGFQSNTSPFTGTIKDASHDLFDMWQQKQMIHSHLIRTRDYLVQWTYLRILIYPQVTSGSALCVTRAHEMIICCFPLHNNQFVVGTNSQHIFVYNIDHPHSTTQLATWHAFGHMNCGCVVSDQTFAVAYKNHNSIDIWTVMGERVQTLSNDDIHPSWWLARCMTWLPTNQLAVGSGTLEIWDQFRKRSKEREWVNVLEKSWKRGQGMKLAEKVIKKHFHQQINHIEPMGNNRMAIVCANGSVKVWNGYELIILSQRQPIQSAIWMDNEYLITRSKDEIVLWE